MEENKENIYNNAGSVAQNASQSQTNKYVTGKDGSTGHGFAAEDANALADILKGNTVEKVGTNNSKNGADRITSGVKIQTKYCKTARATVNAAFDNITGEFKYKVRNGRPMKLEVPSDQYTEAVNIMREKILNGEVKGVKNPDHAVKMVKKGVVTYEQSVKIAKAGTIESLTYDVATGAVSSAAAGGISAVITFVALKRKGVKTKEALKEAGKQGGKAASTSLITQVVVGQTEKAIVRKAAEKTGEVVINEGSKNITKGILATAAKSTLRTNVITGVVTTAVTSIPDINKARKGEITWKECGERTASNATSVASGIAAAAVAVGMLSNPVGWTAMGVSLAAGISGSIAGGTVANKVISFFKKKK